MQRGTVRHCRAVISGAHVKVQTEFFSISFKPCQHITTNDQSHCWNLPIPGNHLIHEIFTLQKVSNQGSLSGEPSITVVYMTELCHNKREVVSYNPKYGGSGPRRILVLSHSSH